MAIEPCSDDNSAGISPRISFSHDFCLSENVPVEQLSFVGSSNSLGSIDFDFCVRKSFDQESSPADELFSDGKILPTEIKKRNKTPPKQTPNPSPDPPQEEEEYGSKKEETKEVKAAIDETEDQKQNSKSFWRFKRSSSLNCVSGYGRSLCPLPPLSRSNSTGSAPNNTVKRVPLSKDTNNSKHHRQAFVKPSSSNSYQKPPLKKNYGTYANGVRVNPVLNVPSGNLFGLGSIFFNGKDKNKKK